MAKITAEKMTPEEIKKLGDKLIDALGGLSYEIGKQVTKVHARPEDWLKDEFIERTVHKAALHVLLDYFLGRLQPRPYVVAADGMSITCTRCGFTSYNPNDIAQKYCGMCKRFMPRWNDDELET